MALGDKDTKVKEDKPRYDLDNLPKRKITRLPFYPSDEE